MHYLRQASRKSAIQQETNFDLSSLTIQPQEYAIPLSFKILCLAARHLLLFKILSTLENIYTRIFVEQ